MCISVLELLLLPILAVVVVVAVVAAVIVAAVYEYDSYCGTNYYLLSVVAIAFASAKVNNKYYFILSPEHTIRRTTRHTNRQHNDQRAGPIKQQQQQQEQNTNKGRESRVKSTKSIIRQSVCTGICMYVHIFVYMYVCIRKKEGVLLNKYNKYYYQYNNKNKY